MKNSRPNIHRPKTIVPAGILSAVTGIFLFVSVPAIYAGGLPNPPKWIPFELKAINLYELGISRESSDMDSAVKTLQQARQESADAIVNGGGSSPAVLHNDNLIGKALMMAQMHATTTPENKLATQTPKTASHPVKPVVQPTIRYAKTSIMVR